MKTLFLALTLLSTPVLAQQPPAKTEVCVDANTVSVLFVKQGEDITLLIRAVTCKKEIATWELNAKDINIITISVKEIQI